jgi:RHS repeat-associated protein
VVISNTLGAAQNYKFNGKERDNESGLDEFGARYHSSPFGRFITPDWAATATAVPYANFQNPQSLNLYSFAKNNPTTFGDPDGHCPDGICENIATLTPDQVEAHAPLLGDRGAQVMNGTGQMLLGGATIASVATAEPGPILAVTGILTGSTLSVRGTANVVGAATNTDVGQGDKVLAATSNPAGLVTTAATGGNVTAGRVAATGQSVAMAVTGAVQNPKSLSSPATVAKHANLVVNIGQLGSQISASAANLIKPPAPPPPPPKPPSPPPCALEGCH